MARTQERDTRQVLLDAASEEFAKHGLPGARMHVIVQRAGINERMIYHHFGSKVGLYEAVLAHHFRAPETLPPAAGDTRPREAKDIDAKARFVNVLTGFVRGLLARPQFLALVLHEAMSGWEHVPKASLADVPDVIRIELRSGAARRQVSQGLPVRGRLPGGDWRHGVGPSSVRALRGHAQRQGARSDGG